MSLAFDIVFAGGGTTACVVAGRLAAADPSLKILVVESGEHSGDVPSVVQPCRYVEHLRSDATTVFFHTSKPSPYLDGRAVPTQCARAVGGGSAVNVMIYTRGAASDFDEWEALGNKGWGFNDLLPFIRKLETFTPTSDRPTHGYSGPVGISAGGVDLGLASQFLNVTAEYDPARPQVEDNNDFKTADAYSAGYKYINAVTGRRSDSASCYLYPHSGNPNLKIEVGKRVKRVIIENGRAVGIEYVADKISCPEASDEVFTVKATKLVIVSAGAFGSPTILERSGIGSPSILEKNNVRVLVDLPGVGENYQDHPGVRPVFYASDDTETMDDIWNDPEAIFPLLKEWEENGTGKIAQNGIEVVAKVRPTASQLASAGPAAQIRWKNFFEHSPDKPMGIIAPSAGMQRIPAELLGRKFICAMNYILYPESIGSVHIASGEDAHAPLDFDSNMFAVDGDSEQLTILYKMSRELFRRLPSYRGEVATFHPVFPLGSAAACKKTDGPVEIDTPDIVYSAADDEAIAKFHRDAARMMWHSLGTCTMKPRDQGGVVDAHLNVYGVENLKVADLSICSTNVGNNTCFTALLIGEKAAAIIAEDLGVRYMESQTAVPSLIEKLAAWIPKFGSTTK